MKRVLLAAFGVFCVTIPQVVLASGNALLPSSTSNSASPAPNLGLGGGAATPTTTPAPQTPPTPPTPPLAAKTATPPITPIPPAPPPTPTSLAPKIIGDTTHLRPGEMPTMVMQQPDLSSALALAGKSLPYSLTFQFSDKSIFGAKDMAEITDKLGLKNNEVSAACLLSVRGLMQTDKSAYIISGGATPQVAVRYDGMIKNYMMAGVALCKAGTLPSGKGLIGQTGDRYAIPLQVINCPIPNRQATTLIITYDGSDKAQCVYN